MSIKGRIERLFFLLKGNLRQLLKILYAKLWPLPKSPFQKSIKGVLFEFDFNFDPQIKNMYYGTYEIETIETIRQYLKKGDIFIDVGANIGYISAIALGIVGTKGQVHSFEPVPKYFNRLQNIKKNNGEYTLVANQCALGEKEGTVKIAVTNLPNIGWNTIVPGIMSDETTREKIDVPLRRLDGYINEKAIQNIALIKIDTEGFEFPVLKGLCGYFENTGHRPVIICEIAPIAYSYLGNTPFQLAEYMKGYGYNAFHINNTNAKIDISRLKSTTNVLFKT